MSAIAQALEKKDIKPSPILCFSLKDSLYLLRSALMAVKSTSLKVVNMAVLFLAESKRLEMVLRSRDIFSVRVFRLPPTAGVAAIWGALGLVLGAGGAWGFWRKKFSTSSFKMRPSRPVPLIWSALMLFSAINLAAAGDG